MEEFNRKQKRLVRDLTDKNTHFKMYKAGKLWFYSGITLLTFGLGGLFQNISVQASTTETSTTTELQQSQASSQGSGSSVTLSSTVSSQASTDTSATSAVTTSATSATFSISSTASSLAPSATAQSVAASVTSSAIKSNASVDATSQVVSAAESETTSAVQSSAPLASTSADVSAQDSGTLQQLAVLGAQYDAATNTISVNTDDATTVNQVKNLARQLGSTDELGTPEVAAVAADSTATSETSAQASEDYAMGNGWALQDIAAIPASNLGDVASLYTQYSIYAESQAAGENPAFFSLGTGEKDATKVTDNFTVYKNTDGTAYLNNGAPIPIIGTPTRPSRGYVTSQLAFQQAYLGTIQAWYQQLSNYFNQIASVAYANNQALANYSNYDKDSITVSSGLAGWLGNIVGAATNILGNGLSQAFGFTKAIADDPSTAAIFNYLSKNISDNPTSTDPHYTQGSIATSVNATISTVNNLINTVIPYVQSIIQNYAYNSIQSLGLKQGDLSKPLTGANSIDLPDTLYQALTSNDALTALMSAVSLTDAAKSGIANSVYQGLAIAIRAAIENNASKGMDESLSYLLEGSNNGLSVADAKKAFSSISGFDVADPTKAAANDQTAQTSLVAESEGYSFANKYGTSLINLAVKDALNGSLQSTTDSTAFLTYLKNAGVLSANDYNGLINGTIGATTGFNQQSTIYTPSSTGAINFLAGLYNAESAAVEQAIQDYTNNPGKIGQVPVWTNPSTGTTYELQDYVQVWNYLKSTGVAEKAIGSADTTSHDLAKEKNGGNNPHVNGADTVASLSKDAKTAYLLSSQLNQSNVISGLSTSKVSDGINQLLPSIYINIYNTEADKTNAAFAAGVAEFNRQTSTTTFEQTGILDGPDKSQDPNGWSGESDGTASLYTSGNPVTGTAFLDGFGSVSDSLIRVEIKTAAADGQSGFPTSGSTYVYTVLKSTPTQITAPIVSGWTAVDATLPVTSSIVNAGQLANGFQTGTLTFTYTKNTIPITNVAVTLGNGSYTWDNGNVSSHVYISTDATPLATVTLPTTSLTVQLTSDDIQMASDGSKVGSYSYSLSAAGLQKVLAAIQSYNSANSTNFGIDPTAITAGTINVTTASAETDVSQGSMLYDSTTKASQFGNTANVPVVTVSVPNANYAITVALTNADVTFTTDGTAVGSYTFTLNASGLAKVQAAINADAVLNGNVTIPAVGDASYNSTFTIIDNYIAATTVTGSNGSKYFDGQNASQFAAGGTLTVSYAGADGVTHVYQLLASDVTIQNDGSQVGSYQYTLSSTGQANLRDSATRNGLTLTAAQLAGVSGTITINATGTVTIHYVDENGHPIFSDTVINNGIYNTQFNITAPVLNGYTLISSPIASGFYSDANQVFTFTYQDSNTGENNTGTNNTGDSNTGNSNSGSNNTGDSNTGNSNSGSNNTGDSNTGNSNSGSNNTGDSNTGNSNSGSNNTGDSNTGNSNSGSNNTGDSNTGNSNSGSNNTGDSNTGNSNSGSNNTGDSNTGNSNSGSNNAGDSNTGNSNSGSNNTGDSNTGNSNSGSNNTGDSNTGNSNSGSNNTGDSNTGNSNSGSNNTGDSNTGNSNSGSNNTGDSNTGNSNSGSNNTGDSNTGNSNSGSNNTGDSNTGNSNSGWNNTGDSNTGNSNSGSNNTGDSNTGNSNSGSNNTGDSNTGNSNSGSNNTGDSNTGNSNSGSNNTGDSNTGNSNSGSNNTGDSNTGNSNSGSNNTGDSNTGNSNSGSNNTGDSNTGNSNSGSNNTGDSNTGNSNSGSNNTGDSNTGNSNSGSNNTGDSNTGNSDSGSNNTGDSNTGNSNSGSNNTGDNNTGNSNSGSNNTGDS
ncbi:MBG domain-containing protein, partial [Furfurilactobacillus curtus]|uniref:MBG domain-containing protein n=1 Tax=Furfurilactobacillus curtus TaxID=1746200 RepID=UPI0038B32FF0